MEDLWKEFGRDTPAGRVLAGLYKVPAKARVYYPPVKTKKRPLPCDIKPSAKPEPVAIDYPSVIKKRKSKFAPIDFVPRRKNEREIKREVDNHYASVKQPVVKT